LRRKARDGGPGLCATVGTFLQVGVRLSERPIPERFRLARVDAAMFDPDAIGFIKILAIAGTLYFAVRGAILIAVAAINAVALYPEF
jgi:hypothetical protein